MQSLGRAENNEEVPSRWQKLPELEVTNKYSSVVFVVTLK